MSVRSLHPISDAHLARLGAIARADLERMFTSSGSWQPYRDRLLCIALCQGAALHYIDGRTGVKDFDVWAFFAESPDRPRPDAALFRRRKQEDFGPSPFGRTDTAPDRFRGRRVDLMARALPVAPDADPAAALRAWLRDAPQRTPRLLAQKAVVLIEPRRGEVVWPSARASPAAG